MNFWFVILLLAVMTGIMGWGVSIFTNIILWHGDWREGKPINWGLEAAYTIAVPFAWIFSILEIYILYAK